MNKVKTNWQGKKVRMKVTIKAGAFILVRLKTPVLIGLVIVYPIHCRVPLDPP